MRARIIRAYIVKPKNIPLISLISQQTVPRDKRDKRVIFPLDSHIYARGHTKTTSAKEHEKWGEMQKRGYALWFERF